MKLLTELLTYQNSQRENYESLIAGIEPRKITCSLPAGHSWARRLKRDHHRLLQHKLKDGILVDLGCGSNDRDWEGMAGLAKYFGVKAYIGVDVFFPYETGSFTNVASPKRKAEYSPLQLVLVCEDMLRFLHQLPDQSVNIAISCIDTNIIRPVVYHQAVAKEIERVTAGIVLGRLADPIDYLSRDIFTEERSKWEKDFYERGSGVFVKK